MNAPLIAPSLLVSLLLVVGYAAIFHLWRGRTLRDLMYYLLASAIGFGVGQLVGTLVRIPLLQMGELHLLEATAGAWLALAIANLALTPSPRRR